MLNVTFTQDELNAMTAILDAAAKQMGLAGVKAVAAIYAKLEGAVAEANAAQASAAGAAEAPAQNAELN